jgi:hypothetical protein
VTRILQSAHAEDVGGRIVEPGEPIPDDADDDVVARLEADGLIVDDDESSSSSSKRKKGSD